MGSPAVDPSQGSPQSEIFYHYKKALIQAIALDRATAEEERLAKQQKRPISPENIERFTQKHLALIPYKSTSCRYHSFVVYFSNLQRLGWVEFTGREEHSALQDNYLKGQPRRYFRLTAFGITATDAAWANPRLALYSSS
jgi:hypothetical protein